MTLITNILEQPRGGRGVQTSLVSFQRPNNALAYAVQDNIGQTAARAIAFPGCGKAGSVVTASLVTNGTGIGDFHLLLFSREPTNFADSVPVALTQNDLDALQGVIIFPPTDVSVLNTAGGLIYNASLADAVGPGTPFVSEDGNIYALLKANNAYTPVANEQFNIRLFLNADPISP